MSDFSSLRLEQDTFDFGPDVPRCGVLLKRDFKGFYQSREDEFSLWVFCVTAFDASFSGESGTCMVLRFDGSEQRVPIDELDRITVAGKKYGRRHWNH